MATTTPNSAASTHHGLPSISSLTNGLPPSSDQRDSGTWPQPQSKLHTLLNHDDSPQRSSMPTTPQSARLPTSTTSQLPSINQSFHDAGNRDSQASVDSRRSSVDSRMHQNFGQLYINNPSSPYESANTSQVSLAASLRRPNGGPLSPMNGRTGLRGHVAPRIAPPIMPGGRVPGGPDPTAAKPTQGFAWAFPDQAIPEERRNSDSGDSSTNGISRTNSFAASSMRSSIFSTDSSMPVGQRRFDDEQNTTHHHSMQPRGVQALQNDALSSSQGVGNYSRTPELRVSHKLAERKRRSEMKDLFEELNKAVPSSAGSKASKWEILSKAIEHIRNSQNDNRQLMAEVQRLQRDSDYGRETHKENEMLRTEVQVMHQHLRRLDPNAPHVYGAYTSQLQQQAGPPSANGASAMALPPLGGGPSGPGPYSGPTSQASMQGVEYGFAR